MINLQRKLLYIFRESPKVGFLLIIGGLILFPLYMMLVISLMTPAQLERFPWFPMKFDEPRDVNVTRAGEVSLEPARLRIEPLAGGSAANSAAAVEGLSSGAGEIPINMNERFYFHLPEIGGEQMQWQVTPQDGKPAVIAEYRASVVCQVREPEPGRYTVVVASRRDEADEELQIPEGFTSVVEGLRQRALMSGELSACEQARKEASDVLKAAERITRVEDEAERSRRRHEAAVQYIVARRQLNLGTAALERASAYAALAERGGVSAWDRIEDARRRIDLARRRLAAAGEIVGDYANGLGADVLAAVEVIKDSPADVSLGFVIDRGDAVAVLTTDVPLTVTRLPGRALLKTSWEYQYDPLRPFVVRPLVDEASLANVQPGAPLAEMVATTDLELIWSDGAWRYDGLALDRYLYPGFRLLVGPPSAGAAAAEGQTLEVSRGAVVARAVMPKAMVWRETDSLIVGLAVPEDDSASDGGAGLVGGGASWRIELGGGRWSYQLYGGADEPFIVTYSGDSDLPSGRPVDVAAGAALAEMVVHRDRELLGLKGVGWSDRSSNVFLSLPAGFGSVLPDPTEEGRVQSQSIAHGTVVGQLRMPTVELEMTDHYLIVRMSGSEFGSGQWQYPLGAVQTLAVRSALQGSAADGGAAVEYRPAASFYDTAELVAARDELAALRRQAERTAPDPIVVKRAAQQELEQAERRYAELMQANAPADTVARLVATRPALLTYEGQWQLDGRPIVWPAGFVPLDGVGELLSGTRRDAMVEPGTVLALLRAEQPHDWTVERDRGASLVTFAQQDAEGRGLRVWFEHELQMPVRSIVKVRDGQLVEAGATVLSFFTPMRFDTANYGEAWGYVKDFIINTIIVALLTVIFSLFFSSLAAFVFSRFQFPGKALFYASIIVLLMIPGVLNLVPLYVIVKNLGLLESTRLHAILVLVLPAVAGGQVMGVYIMRNNLETLAKDLFDAAKIDGASNWQTYWHIAIPLSKPIMGTLAIFALLSQWNNFIWPWLVIKEERLMPVTAGLAKLEGQHLSDYGLQMAGAVLASLPVVILFFFMMNLFIRGMQSGAIKA